MKKTLELILKELNNINNIETTINNNIINININNSIITINYDNDEYNLFIKTNHLDTELITSEYSLKDDVLHLIKLYS